MFPSNTLMAAVQQIMANRQGQPQQQPARSPFGTQLMQALMRLQQQREQPKPQMPGGAPAIPGYKWGQQMQQPQQPDLGGPRASGMVNPRQWGV